MASPTRSLACAALALPLLLAASPAQADAATHPRHPPTVAAIEAMVDAGSPGVLARVDRLRRHWTATRGVAEIDTDRRRTPHEHFRIGSVTKTFTAVTLLTLEAAGELSLDDSVETWLPGVLDHNGYDGRAISVRQLLNHTSGVFDVLADPDFNTRYRGDAFLEHRYDDWTPRRLVDIALDNRPVFDPGDGWAYSNTNYVLAAMIVDAVTGEEYAEVLDERVLRPLGLTGTSVPGHSPRLPRPHPHAYSHLWVPGPDAPVYDTTAFDPSMAAGAGDIVSTARDLNRFFGALVGGRFLPPAQQRALLDVEDTGKGEGYGLGVRTYSLPCATLWGNDGDILGSVTYTVSSPDGRHVLTLNANENWTDDELAEDVLEAEFCRG